MLPRNNTPIRLSPELKPKDAKAQTHPVIHTGMHGLSLRLQSRIVDYHTVLYEMPRFLLAIKNNFSEMRHLDDLLAASSQRSVLKL